MREQSYANHARYTPLYHFVVLPLLSGYLILEILDLVREPGRETIGGVIVAFALVALAFASRGMAITVQNRVIRLEERLRLERVLPPERHAEIGRLTVRQLIALRFASDAEVPDLVRRVLGAELDSQTAIKQSIRDWRPDYLRC